MANCLSGWLAVVVARPSSSWAPGCQSDWPPAVRLAWNWPIIIVCLCHRTHCCWPAPVRQTRTLRRPSSSPGTAPRQGRTIRTPTGHQVRTVPQRVPSYTVRYHRVPSICHHRHTCQTGAATSHRRRHHHATAHTPDGAAAATIESEQSAWPAQSPARRPDHQPSPIAYRPLGIIALPIARHHQSSRNQYTRRQPARSSPIIRHHCNRHHRQQQTTSNNKSSPPIISPPAPPRPPRPRLSHIGLSGLSINQLRPIAHRWHINH